MGFFSKVFEGDDAVLAQELLNRAHAGDTDAQYQLGRMSHKGEGIFQDSKKAIELFARPVNQGNAEAQAFLGGMYLYGDGVPKDSKKAFESLTMAAIQGHDGAQFLLGVMYVTGDGVPKNPKKAREWFTKSANRGNAGARAALNELMEDDDFDDDDSELRLIDVIEKTNNLLEGVFANINNDLGEHFSTQNKVSSSSPMILMAYAYARRTAAAGLFLQGVFDRETYAIASNTFKAMQLQTGHTVEFQEEAARQANELLSSYDSRLDKQTIGTITTIVEHNQTPEQYDGKNHIPYDLVMANLQYAINKKR